LNSLGQLLEWFGAITRMVWGNYWNDLGQLVKWFKILLEWPRTLLYLKFKKPNFNNLASHYPGTWIAIILKLR